MFMVKRVYCLCAVLLLAQGALAQTWNGLGGNDNWQTNANWSAGLAPVNNGTANVFFGGATRLTPNVDVAYNINSLTFNNTAGANLFTISGSALTIGAGGVTNNDADNQTINSSVIVNAPQSWSAGFGTLTFNSAIGLNASNILTFNGAVGNSTISGSISGSGSLTKNSPGALTLSGGGNNVFSGALTVNAGTVIFAKTPGLRAFGGALTIGDGSGIDTIQYAASNQTSLPSPVINSSGVLDLNGFSDTYQNLTINGGSTTVGAGSLTINTGLTITGGSVSGSGAGKLMLLANLTTNANATSATISGTFDFGAAIRSLTIADGVAAADLDLSANLTNGGFIKNGPGTLRLSGSVANSYSAQTIVNAGTLELAKSSQTVSIPGGIIIGDDIGGPNADVVRYSASGQVANNSVVSVHSSGLLDLNNFSDAIGGLDVTGGNVTMGNGVLTITDPAGGVSAGLSTQTGTISGVLFLNDSNKVFSTLDSPTLAVELDVSASIQHGQITKEGQGTLRLSGGTPNTVSSMLVNNGMLLLGKSIPNAAVSGSLTIGDGNGVDTVRLESPNQIADTSSITITSSGVLDLAGQNDTVGPIAIHGGGEIVTGAGTLTAAGDISSIDDPIGQGIIMGNLALLGTRNISVEDGAASPDFYITANISGGTLVMNGPGELYLSGNNTAPIVLNAGTLTVQHDYALGPSAAALNGGTLRALGLRTIATPLNFGGPVTLNVDTSLTLSGILGGTSTVTKTGPGSLTLTGPQSIALDLVLNQGLLTAPNLILDAQGSLTMNNGGFSGTLDNHGTFTYNAGNFNGTLINRGTVLFNNPVVAINSITNYADLALGNGSFLTTGSLTNNGQITLSGATLNLTSPSVNNGGITGFGLIGGPSQFTNNGVITQGAGNLNFNSSSGQTNNGNIDLAPGRQITFFSTALNNQGTINLNGAVVGLGQPLINSISGTVAGRGTIQTFFSNNGLLLVLGGTTNITSAFSNTGTIQVAGLGASLIGGKVSNTGTIQGNGAVGSDVDNNGTIEALGGTLIFGGVVNNAGTIAASAGNKVLINGGLASNTGIINLTGGTFDNNGLPLANAGQISGYGSFRAGSFTNNGSMTFSGGASTINGGVTNSAAHQIRVAYTPALFTGNVVNNGIFKNTSTTITFAGTYVENGTFISDPADNFFNNVNIGPTGAWVGGHGDRFFVSGDFLNASTNVTQWNTAAAELHLISGGIGDRFQVSGKDLGVTFAGYDDNFAWGKLSLAVGRALTLIDADALPGGAIYVDHLDLQGGLAQIETISSNGMNLYYHLGNPANAYLNGGTYLLAGGGTIAPVPEPGIAFAGVAAAALLLARRRRGNR